jgi:hypothetical protein
MIFVYGTYFIYKFNVDITHIKQFIETKIDMIHLVSKKL